MLLPNLNQVLCSVKTRASGHQASEVRGHQVRHLQTILLLHFQLLRDFRVLKSVLYGWGSFADSFPCQTCGAYSRLSEGKRRSLQSKRSPKTPSTWIVLSSRYQSGCTGSPQRKSVLFSSKINDRSRRTLRDSRALKWPRAETNYQMKCIERRVLMQ